MPIEVEIVSPEKVLFSRAVDMAVIPGLEGDIAAMPDHAPMMLLLRGGVVELHQDGKVTDRFFVAGGFADMTATRCTILADAATALSDLSVEAAQARLQELQASYDAADKMDVPALDLLMAKMQSVRAEIEAAGGAAA
ncbi:MULTISPECIES: ATP synthase F1 subunit epsilon [Nguyenibacter]|uniref:ATP synthase epsilon chain n=1 Tax=Nguyenibacter vanlangensis TaxID=1216886 RepID=A0A7Y7IWG0_9PROT|nr:MULTISPECIES: ATP synthase F1 subunit epsilon [Nguyenibacter]NVN11293.1 ATP synthase F1 subunit epsilon [Nguyenibacter vanlangensis]WRH87292.1 ATP synthase F1 subunit epsilon [Nguyenibacter sp. L1]